MNDKKDMHLAVLIDADNIPYANVQGMLDEIAKLGTPTIKRIYGDWTRPGITGWKAPLLEHAITPIQQYGYTTGKNATDSAMIIDAMDILHSDKVGGFCLVSSDSDFTRLATRIRESGKLVIGIGEKKTPKPFIVACDKFIYIEIIAGAKVKQTQVNKTKKTTDKQVPPAEKDEVVSEGLINLLKFSVDDIGDDDGWASLAEVGSLLLKKKPDFDPRNYGFPKLTPFIKSLSKHFIIDARKSERSNIQHIYLKNK
ncbi:MAG: NYN domain-containing protein [Crocinitomix sp.]|nr:NYN domain-containing protein [Crocinitomix sp.]